MSGQGTTVVDFGAFPGVTDVTVAITGQTLISGAALVEAWVFPTDTADHTADEHWVDPPRVFAGNVSAGVGFTIYARGDPDNGAGDSINSGLGQGMVNTNGGPSVCWGKWTVAWVWNG